MHALRLSAPTAKQHFARAHLSKTDADVLERFMSGVSKSKPSAMGRTE